MTQRHRFALALLALPLLGGIAVAVWLTLPYDEARYVAPIAASLLVFALFSLVLRRQVRENIFGEIGFLYVGFIVAYTVLPALGFLLAGIEGGPLSWLLPDPDRLAMHLWRHVLYESGVAIGYLLLRGRVTSSGEVRIDAKQRDGRTLVFVSVLLVVCISSMILMSAPVSSYYDHYVRYDHLPWLPRKFISLSIRLSLGLYCVLLVFLFRNYAKFKLVIPIVVLMICAHEITYSYGARIQSLIVLLLAVCLYHYTVKKVSLQVGVLAFVALAVLFSAVEIVRVMQGDFDLARSVVAEEGFKPAAEFSAVFFPSFHLYSERAQGALPPTEWPMFFNDFISLFTFGDFTRWNPMYWYAAAYDPSVDVPPFTLGPIADSAIWGGELDLLIRSLINGAFFAFIMRWFLRYRHKWWGLSVYVYCYSTCILTLKYSVFLHLNLLEKNLLPTLLLVHAVRVLRFESRPRAVLTEA